MPRPLSVFEVKQRTQWWTTLFPCLRHFLTTVFLPFSDEQRQWDDNCSSTKPSPLITGGGEACWRPLPPVAIQLSFRRCCAFSLGETGKGVKTIPALPCPESLGSWTWGLGREIISGPCTLVKELQNVSLLLHLGHDLLQQPRSSFCLFSDLLVWICEEHFHTSVPMYLVLYCKGTGTFRSIEPEWHSKISIITFLQCEYLKLSSQYNSFCTKFSYPHWET